MSNITTEMMSMVSFNINMTSGLNMSEPELVSSCEEENMTLDIATGKLFEPQKKIFTFILQDLGHAIFIIILSQCNRSESF